MNSFPSAKLGSGVDIHWRPLKKNHGHLVDSSPRLLEHFLDTTLLADRRTEGVEGKGHLSNFPNKKETNGAPFFASRFTMSVPFGSITDMVT